MVSKEHTEEKSEAMRYVEMICSSKTWLLCIFQHFQTWWWVEYSDIFESHQTFSSRQADFFINEVMTKLFRVWGASKFHINSINTTFSPSPWRSPFKRLVLAVETFSLKSWILGYKCKHWGYQNSRNCLAERHNRQRFGTNNLRKLEKSFQNISCE